MTKQEILSQRSRRSRSRGRGGEGYVIKRLTGWGYQAKRMVLSGGNLAKPYDVIVSPFRLKIEVKRRMAEAITINHKWLRKVAPKYIVVFGIGPRMSEMNRLYAISLFRGKPFDGPQVSVVKDRLLRRANGQFVIRRPGLSDLVISGDFCLVHGEKKFLVQDFCQYMKENWTFAGERIKVGELGSMSDVRLIDGTKETKDV